MFQLGSSQDWTTYNLFLCHFLSTWNARSYEFAAVLFTAAAFPEGLSAASWIGITTNLAIIIFASSLGRWVDHAPSRLRTLLTTVSVNRVVVIAACVCWAVIINSDVHEDVPTSTDPTTEPTDARPLKLHQWKDALFLLILALGILERLSRLANLVSIERDWVPTMVAAGVADKDHPPYDLSRLNAVMSRIDLICKLGSPIAISAFMSATESPRLGALLLIGLNLMTWPFEYWTARTLWQGNEQLREAKVVDGSDFKDLSASGNKSDAGFTLHDLLTAFKSTLGWISQYGRSLQQYFATEVWMPSLAMSTLHFSILTFSSTLIVFLVNSGFSMALITCAEVLSAAFELSSTFIFPWAVRLLGNNQQSAYHPLPDNETPSTPTTPLPSTFEVHDDIKATDIPSSEQYQITGVSKLGLLAITLTLLALIPSVPAIWHIATSWPTTLPTDPSAWHSHRLLIIVIILFISASRFGRFTSALCAQQLAQSCVRPAQRSVFAGTEASFASAFGLAHYSATVVWSSRKEFRWVALASVAVVAGGVGLYAFWLLRGRGRGGV
ncbi:MAG: hypothetical protein ALECFALPRED_009014 [Alectoria fallacina]|uniref:Solute carrier family 40 member n=1 Tax=Alectoria fallacina TaxID=1903189 RepID=A0A8H3J5R9_9LECA|nr:MAG: hypothetical protein ALECFALPRED_009014 [Alectoria fallacina]